MLDLQGESTDELGYYAEQEDDMNDSHSSQGEMGMDSPDSGCLSPNQNSDDAESKIFARLAAFPG